MSSTLIGRGRRALREHGGRDTVLRATDEVRARLELRRQRRKGPQTFVVDGVELVQLVHPYNRTWRNERAVEIPVAEAFLVRQSGPVLEVGNVLGSYGRRGHVVVDKYEQRPGVLNVDVVEYQPDERFGAVVALSTLEHVGWDEDPRDAAKIPLAVRHLRDLLLPSGRLLLTCPLSYNPHLDALIAGDALGADRQAFLVRGGGVWTQADRAEAFASAQMGRYGASALWVAELPR